MRQLIGFKVIQDIRLSLTSRRDVVELRFIDDETRNSDGSYMWDKGMTMAFALWDERTRSLIGDRITEVLCGDQDG